MDENYIWAYYSMKKGDLDNDYYFYEDGRIFHHYDRTIQKRDIESYISSSEIPISDKQKIMEQCMAECSDELVEQIKKILNK